MTVTITTFLTSFPEFSNCDVALVNSTVQQVICETCNYNGYRNLGRNTEADCILHLHIAHVLELANQSKSKFANGNKVKSLKTKQDAIEYFGNPTDPFGFMNTSYGKRLLKAREGLYVPFCL